MTYQERIYSQAVANGMPDILARLIVSQASFETAYNGIPFNSPVFKSCRNCFGYKYVGQKTAEGACTGSPEGDNYARYADIEQSVTEITQWIRRRQASGVFPADLRLISSPYQYAALLKDAGFYGVSVAQYSNGLELWWAMVQGLSLSTRTAGIGFLLLLGGGFAWYYRKQLFTNRSFTIFG